LHRHPTPLENLPSTSYQGQLNIFRVRAQSLLNFSEGDALGGVKSRSAARRHLFCMATTNGTQGAVNARIRACSAFSAGADMGARRSANPDRSAILEDSQDNYVQSNLK
jgi:hypothetical protein